MSTEMRRDLYVLSDDIGERNVSSCYQGLQRTVKFLEQKLRESGYEIQLQQFTAGGKHVCNLIVERKGFDRPDEIIVIGAHYDTVPGSPGANDNGSAVVANLALARALKDARLGRTVRFAFFANEEFPYYMTDEMGSLRYAEQCQSKDDNLIGMICLETIGCYLESPGSQTYPHRALTWLYPTTGDFIAFVANRGNRRWVKRVVRAFRRTSFPSEGIAAPEKLRDIFRSDHAAFWSCGYPALMVTDTANFRYQYYHTAEDTADKIDFHSLARVVSGLEGAIVELAAFSCGWTPATSMPTPSRTQMSKHG